MPDLFSLDDDLRALMLRIAASLERIDAVSEEVIRTVRKIDEQGSRTLKSAEDLINEARSLLNDLRRGVGGL